MADTLKKWQVERNVACAAARRVDVGNVVRFDALECRLSGHVRGVSIGPYAAVSGAGLNSPSDFASTSFAKWTPTKGKTGDLTGQRGGVIPPGLWIILPEILRKGERSPSMVEGGETEGGAPTDFSLKLVPYELRQDSLGHAEPRSGFYIHGASKDPSKRGAGSDGCILMNKLDREYLAAKVVAAGGAWLVVDVNRQRLEEIRQFQHKFQHRVWNIA